MDVHQIAYLLYIYELELRKNYFIYFFKQKPTEMRN